MNPLTNEQVIFARQAVSRWLRVREQHENLEQRLHVAKDLTVSQKKMLLTQIAADVDHSALLDRMLRGKDPLPEPPTTEHAYPVYPDDE